MFTVSTYHLPDISAVVSNSRPRWSSSGRPPASKKFRIAPVPVHMIMAISRDSMRPRRSVVPACTVLNIELAGCTSTPASDPTLGGIYPLPTKILPRVDDIPLKTVSFLDHRSQRRPKLAIEHNDAGKPWLIVKQSRTFTFACLRNSTRTTSVEYSGH